MKVRGFCTPSLLRVLAAELGQLAEALRWGRMRERSKRRA